MMTFPPLADHAGAMQAVNAIQSALLGRVNSGKGAFLDISLFDSAMAWQYLGLSEAEESDPMKREQLLLNGGAACYNIYQTAAKITEFSAESAGLYLDFLYSGVTDTGEWCIISFIAQGKAINHKRRFISLTAADFQSLDTGL